MKTREAKAWRACTQGVKTLCLGSVLFYQKWIRMVLPQGRCIYEPSCSNYALEALQKHGVAKGLYLTISRVLRCHPFQTGGYDPVP